MVDEGFVTVGSIMGSRIYRCSSESGGEEEGARDERWPVETPSLSKLGVMSPLAKHGFPETRHRCRYGAYCRETIFFAKFQNINAPQRHIPCAILTKFAKFVRHFMTRYIVVKISLDLFKGLKGFKLMERVPPNFQRPLAVKLCVGPQKFWKCKNVLEVLYHRAKFDGARISPTAGATKKLSFYRQHFKLLDQRAILRFFTPQERHIASMGVKFGTKEWTSVHSSVPNLATIGATIRV